MQLLKKEASIVLKRFAEFVEAENMMLKTKKIPNLLLFVRWGNCYGNPVVCSFEFSLLKLANG
jgi:hypothetical protein